MKKLHFFLIILLIIFLRLPSFFEPHWNFDESIYLTISQNLKRGMTLYQDVYDLKPPFIYFTYFFAQSHLLGARILATISTTVVSFVLFSISKNFLASLIFIFLTSIPTFEGQTANTEIFMILPISLAFLMILKRGTKINYFIIGFLFSLAFLFKIVAIFDFIAFNLFLLINSKKLKSYFNKLFFQILGFSFPLFMIFLYFLLNQALSAFINSVFLYNFDYINQQLLFFKGLLLSVFCLFLFIYRQKINKFYLMAYLWFAFSLFATLFAGRPYPHYFLQVLPSFSLIIASLISKPLTSKRLIPLFLTIFVFVSSFLFFNFYRYPFRSYYKNFFLFITRQKSYEEYIKFFNPLLPSVYKVAFYLKEKAEFKDSLFIFGDYPQIYEISQVIPASRFLASRHLELIPEAKKEVINSLKKNPPKFIVFIYPTNFVFMDLEEFIKLNYLPSFSQENIRIFQFEQSLKQAFH